MVDAELILHPMICAVKSLCLLEITGLKTLTMLLRKHLFIFNLSTILDEV